MQKIINLVFQLFLSSSSDKYPDIVIGEDSKAQFKVISKVFDIIPKL